MATDWRRLAPAAREAQLNPRLAVGDAVAQNYLAGYAQRSRAARLRLAGIRDRRYGPQPKATFDLFRPATAPPHPAFVFLHGGYWRALDKDEHSFVVEPAVAAGFAGLVVNYDLCPQVTLDAIVAEMRAFMAHLAEHAGELGLRTDGIALAGHSAGAHLAAMLLHDPGPRGRLAIYWAELASGIYEPEAALDLGINDEIRLTPEVARRNNALAYPPTSPLPVRVTAGAAEPPAWRAQSDAYAELVRGAGCEVERTDVAGADHFSLLDTAIVPPLKARV
jgi:arylformamidase